MGAGTVINFQMKVMGQLQTFHADITEPEPGRVLVETSPDTNIITTFTVDPREGGQQAYVTIATQGPTRDGLAGKIEGWLTPKVLHPIYVKELNQLAEVVAQ